MSKIRAVCIPASDKAPVQLVDVGTDWEELRDFIGGECEYIEMFKTPLTREFGLMGVTDEMGQYHDGGDNPRAWALYPVPGYMLKGDILVVSVKHDPLEGDEIVDLYDERDALLRVSNLVAGVR